MRRLVVPALTALVAAALMTIAPAANAAGRTNVQPTAWEWGGYAAR